MLSHEAEESSPYDRSRALTTALLKPTRFGSHHSIPTLALLIVTYLIIALVARPSDALAEDSSEGNNRRNNVWTVGITGARYSLKSGDGNALVGNATSVGFGTGYIGENWFSHVGFEFMFGPYDPARNGQFAIDTTGTGFTIWTGLSAQTAGIREAAGSYGFGLGLRYADLVGRSIGRNLKESPANDAANARLLDNYLLRLTDFSVIPSLFFSWLQERRQAGTSPELLKTRLEGFILTLGVAMPVSTTYQVKFTRRTRRPRDGDVIEGSSTREQGKMRGYSILATLTAFLGV